MRRLLVVMSLCALLLTGLVGWVARASPNEPTFACLRGYSVSVYDEHFRQEHLFDINSGQLVEDLRRRLPPIDLVPTLDSPDEQATLHCWKTSLTLLLSNRSNNEAQVLLQEQFKLLDVKVSHGSQPFATLYSPQLFKAPILIPSTYSTSAQMASDTYACR